MRVHEIARFLEGEWEGDGDRLIGGVEYPAFAEEMHLAFLEPGEERQARYTRAGCLIVSSDFQNASNNTVIRVKDPRVSFVRIAALFHAPRAGIHPTAVIGAGCTLEGVSVGAHVTIGQQARVGKGTTIASGCRIGAHVTIGTNCTIHANVTLYDSVQLGDGVVLHSGCIIGSDGFGYDLVEGHYERTPHFGHVKVGNEVEIGANTCVDRGHPGVTTIGDGTKLDNMVHVGHGCTLGCHVVVEAKACLSPGAVIHDYARIAAGVGIGARERVQRGASLERQASLSSRHAVRRGQKVLAHPGRSLGKRRKESAGLARMGRRRA